MNSTVIVSHFPDQSSKLSSKDFVLLGCVFWEGFVIKQLVGEVMKPEYIRVWVERLPVVPENEPTY